MLVPQYHIKKIKIYESEVILMESYISNKDKKYIERYCKIQMEQGDLIRVKSLACLLEYKYCLCEILQYIKEALKVDSKYIWRADSSYTIKLPRGHIQFTGMDLYYPNIYYHQYVVAKELDLDIVEVQKYIIHHIDQNKGNNNISNLWIFYDTACHIAYHQAIKHNPNIDIKQFTMDYIEGIINKDNSKQIKDYLDMLDKLQKAKNKKCLSIGVDKHSN